MITNQAHPLWTCRSDAISRSGSGGGRLTRRGCGAGLGLGERLGGDVDELGDLVVGEPGQLAELLGQVDRVLVVLAAEAAKAEQMVDGSLEVEGRLLALGILGGETPQPVRAHLPAGDLAG